MQKLTELTSLPLLGTYVTHSQLSMQMALVLIGQSMKLW